MGGLGQDSSIFFPRFLTNANISLLAFIPQDWKYNFMITSLLEPCLIIPNYEARHLVRSVNPTVQPEQQLACCSVCVQSPWYHRWACFPILAGYNAGTYAVVLIIQHAIVQEGVYSVSPASAFFSNLLRSLPKHGAWSISGPACGSWGQLALIVGKKTKQKLSTKDGFKFQMKGVFVLKLAQPSTVTYTNTNKVKNWRKMWIWSFNRCSSDI